MRVSRRHARIAAQETARAADGNGNGAPAIFGTASYSSEQGGA